MFILRFLTLQAPQSSAEAVNFVGRVRNRAREPTLLAVIHEKGTFSCSLAWRGGREAVVRSLN